MKKKGFMGLLIAGLLAGLLLPANVAVLADPSDGLVSYWPLDGDADDYVDGNDGTEYGTPDYVAGVFGQALSLDGTVDYVQVADDGSLDCTEAITVAGWIKLDSLNQRATVASKWDDLGGDHRGYLLTVANDNTPRFYISTTGIDFPKATGSALSVDTWYHLAGTYDGANIKLYVDGILAQTVACSGDIFSNSEPLLIGANDGYGGSGRKFTDGLVDDVGIWDVALSAEDVESIYEDGIWRAASEKEMTLYAGQDIPVGTVTVWNDASYLHVEYETTDGWWMTETHFEVVCDDGVAGILDDFPTTKSGNPKVGQFTHGMRLDPPKTGYGEDVALAGLDCGTLYIAANAAVVGPECEDSPYYASAVVSYEEGTSANKNNPLLALGAPDSSGDPDWTGHVNLGFGGSLTVEFESPVANSDGTEDISIHEVSPAGSALESAEVYVIVDGVETWVATIDNTGIVSPAWTKTIWVAIPDGLDRIDAVKIVDTSTAGANGFDIDAVDAACLLAQEETAWADGDPFNSDGKGNWATYFGYDVLGFMEE